MLLVATFIALAVIARLACIDPNHNTVLWPANGALVVALMTLPSRFSIPVTAICLLLNVERPIVGRRPRRDRGGGGGHPTPQDFG